MRKRRILLSFLYVTLFLGIPIYCFAYSPLYLEADINHDYKVDISDVAFYFKYAAMSRDSTGSGIPDSIMQRLDSHRNGVLDIEDAKAWVYRQNNKYYYGCPYYILIYTHPDSLPEMNEAARVIASEQLTVMKVLWPDKRGQIQGILRQFGVTDQPPVPINPDLSGDGGTDVVDIVRFFTLLTDSLQYLPELPVAEGMDYNVDGRVDILDAIPFIHRIAADEEWEAYLEGPSTFPFYYRFSSRRNGLPIPNMGGKAATLALRQAALVYEDAVLSNPKFPTNYGLGHDMKLFCNAYDLPFPPPRPWPGDIDADSLRTAADAAEFFNFLFDKAPAGMYREDLDFNLDSKVDSLDGEYFLFFLFREGRALAVPSGQSMSRNSQRRTINFLEEMKNRHPEWVEQSGEGRCRQLLQALVPLPLSDSPDPDLNGDRRVNVFDLLTLLRWGASGDMRADWSGDNAFNGLDILMFLGCLQR
jgi:hypothetical protein